MSVDPVIVQLRRARIAERRKVFPSEVEEYRRKALARLEREIEKMTARHLRDLEWRESNAEVFPMARNEAVFLAVLNGESYVSIGRRIGLTAQRVSAIYRELYWRFPPASDDAPIPEPPEGLEIPGGAE